MKKMLSNIFIWDFIIVFLFHFLFIAVSNNNYLPEWVYRLYFVDEDNFLILIPGILVIVNFVHTLKNNKPKYRYKIIGMLVAAVLGNIVDYISWASTYKYWAEYSESMVFLIFFCVTEVVFIFIVSVFLHPLLEYINEKRSLELKK